MADTFATRVLDWFDTHGRKHLPWQQHPTPYRVWISEIMLQQTQVNTVIPYFTRFMQRFPDVLTLANAPQDEVLQHWQGLGYYARARNLHKAAQTIRDQYAGQFPTTLVEVQYLSGIGPSTAGAILSLSLGQAHPILDGNVKRVLARYHGIKSWTGLKPIEQQLWHYAAQHLPTTRNAAYTQAMMDMGATVCTRTQPLCLYCPLQTDCDAFKHGTQTQIPAPRPAKTLPTKTTTVLLLRNTKDEWLLQRRPETGIWGGLWSFPEFDNTTTVCDWLNAHDIQTYITLPSSAEWTHTFSHYRLIVQPFRVDLHASQTRIMATKDWLWYKAGSSLTGGLSAAARHWFQGLMQGEDSP